jgi:hypothetical protein
MPDEQGQSVQFIEIIQDGQAHGIVSWYKLSLSNVIVSLDIYNCYS